MSEMPEVAVPNPQIDRSRLGDLLEKAAQRLDGVRLQHFVDQRSLCGSCKHARITRQSSRNNRQIRCNEIGQVMPDDITECSDYAAFGSLSLGQMAEIATLIDDRPDRHRGYL